MVVSGTCGDRLPSEPYNLLAVALTITLLSLALRSYYRLYRTLKLHQASSRGRFVIIEGLGQRLQALEGLTRAHLDAVAHACQVSAPSEVMQCRLPSTVLPLSLRPMDPTADGFRTRLGVAFTLGEGPEPVNVQLFWGVDWASAWVMMKELLGEESGSHHYRISPPRRGLGRRIVGGGTGNGSAESPVSSRLSYKAVVPRSPEGGQRLMMLRRQMGLDSSAAGGRSAEEGPQHAHGSSSTSTTSMTELVSLAGRHMSPFSSASNTAPSSPGMAAPPRSPPPSAISQALSGHSLYATPPRRIEPGASFEATFDESADNLGLRDFLYRAIDPTTSPPPMPPTPLIILVRPETVRRCEVEATLTFVAFQRVEPPPPENASAAMAPPTAAASAYSGHHSRHASAELPTGHEPPPEQEEETRPPAPPASPGSPSSDHPKAQAMQQLCQMGSEFFSLHEVYGMDDPAQPECVICLTETKDAILLPCRHLCVCKVCLHFISKCPVCRSPFERYLVFQKDGDGALAAAGADGLQDNGSSGDESMIMSRSYGDLEEGGGGGGGGPLLHHHHGNGR